MKVPEYIRDPLAPKVKAVKSRLTLADFARSHPFCQACGAEPEALHIHHIIGGRGGRSDENCNLLRLCGLTCHWLAEGLDVQCPAADALFTGVFKMTRLPKLPLGVQLSLKLRAVELDNAALARLTQLHGKRLPDLEAIPVYFERLYQINQQRRGVA